MKHSIKFHSPPRRSRTGLTLIELLVVLSIIAVLSTVALRSVVGVVEERRYQANLDQMEALDEAVRGRPGVSGFIADLGRLPEVTGTDPAEVFGELWEGAGLPAYAIQTAAGDAEVSLGTGWRGPYLAGGLRRDRLFDGFGFPFNVFRADGAVAGPGDAIAIVQSLGADNSPGGSDFNADQNLVWQADGGAVAAGLSDVEADRWRTSLTVEVDFSGGPIDPADGSTLILRVYGPDGATGTLRTLNEQTHTLAATQPSHTFTVEDLPYGPKVFRAYQAGSGPATPESPITATHRSVTRTIGVDRTTSFVTLTLF